MLETPNIRKILDIFAPITFPIAKLSKFFLTADIATVSSGSELPTAVTVIPIKVAGTPKSPAKYKALSVNYSYLTRFAC